MVLKFWQNEVERSTVNVTVRLNTLIKVASSTTFARGVLFFINCFILVLNPCRIERVRTCLNSAVVIAFALASTYKTRSIISDCGTEILLKLLNFS